ncbi:MAG: rod shape-determining protein MreD [Candidatus Hydrogenedentes bacterium]|nr:rod shape-determining protein MreD [Candidatus Hydrogenedentota bacterium]
MKPRAEGGFQSNIFVMRKNVFWFVAVVLGALLQSTWPDFLKVEGVLPDLTLILVIYFAIVDGEERAMFTGLLGGIYQDVASNTVLGHHVLCLVILGYIVARFSHRLVTEHPAIKAALVFGAAVAHGVLFTSILYVQKPDISPLFLIVMSVVPAAFYSALVTPVVFLLLGLTFHRKELIQGAI